MQPWNIKTCSLLSYLRISILLGWVICSFQKNFLTIFIKNYRTDGIEIRGLGPAPIPRRKGGEPVLETYKFVPYEASLEINDSVRSLVQLILENSNTVQVKIVELLLEDKEENDLICPIMQKALQDLPLIRQEVIVLSKKSIELANATIQNKPLEAESNVLILILSNILETTEVRTH